MRMRARLDVAAGLLPGIHLLVLLQRLGALSHRLIRHELEELGASPCARRFQQALRHLARPLCPK